MVSGVVMRIVSLVPSLSETVYLAGLENELSGITSFCTHPPQLHRTAQIVGGTKDPDVELLKSLRPTHVLANKEENRKEDVEALRDVCEVLVTSPKTIDDVPELLQSMGRFLNCSKLYDMAEKFVSIRNSNLETHEKSFYFMWNDPFMVAGKDTYISSALAEAGIENACARERYPEWNPESKMLENVDRLYFSSEPFPFKKRHLISLREVVPKHVEFYKIDGQIMSWYGVTSLKLVESIAKASSRGEHPLHHCIQKIDFTS